MKKRPDGRYKVSLSIDGKRHYFYGRTIKEAEQRRNKYKNTLHSAPNIDYNITLGQGCLSGYEAPGRLWQWIHMNHTYISYVNTCYQLWQKSSWSIYNHICSVS